MGIKCNHCGLELGRYFPDEWPDNVRPGWMARLVVRLWNNRSDRPTAAHELKRAVHRLAYDGATLAHRDPHDVPVSHRRRCHGRTKYGYRCKRPAYLKEAGKRWCHIHYAALQRSLTQDRTDRRVK